MNHLFTKTIVVFASAIMLTQLSAKAQNITGSDIKEQFVKDWERAKAYTLEYLNTMPADKYTFKAVDSIRSFAQQMLHLSAGNVGLIQFASGAKLDFPSGQTIEKGPGAQSKDSVVYYVTKSYDFAIQSVKDFDPAKFGEMVGPANRQATRYAIFLKAFEHQTHHRGQTTIYIRLVGIRPPNERLF